MMNNVKHLLQTLRAEWSLHLKHVQLLQAQQTALLSCDRDEFCRLHTQHEALLAQIAAHTKVRDAALRDETGAPRPLSAWLVDAVGRTRQTLENLQNGLRETLRLAQTLTQRNAQLIENDLTFFAYMMDLYVDVARLSGDGYGGHAPAAGRLGLDRRA